MCSGYMIVYQMTIKISLVFNAQQKNSYFQFLPVLRWIECFCAYIFLILNQRILILNEITRPKDTKVSTVGQIFASLKSWASTLS